MNGLPINQQDQGRRVVGGYPHTADLRDLAADGTRQQPPQLIQVNAYLPQIAGDVRMWQPISTAPSDRDLELAVLDKDGPHCLVFPCRRISGGWISSKTRARIEVWPTHWRDWNDKP